MRLKKPKIRALEFRVQAEGHGYIPEWIGICSVWRVDECNRF